MAYTFMFPGQGSQKVGMGADLYEKYDAAKRRFDQANEALNKNLSSLCFEGPDEELKATQNTQPALFTVEAALVDVLREAGLNPAMTMGHSLGEYSALYGAGVFDFETGLRLVARRGELMSQAGSRNPGSMAAIIGLDRDSIASALARVDNGVVVLANENSPIQTVISGESQAVRRACEACKESGAKRAVPLPVSGAFHSPLMQEAADDFKEAVNSAEFAVPFCPVIANVTAQLEIDPLVLKGLLIKQLLAPVRWVDSVLRLQENQCGTCLEVGPGNVLQGLVKKTNPELKVVSCATSENVYSLSQ
ncbi:MAG: ACP S-malonyltransferase [Chitinivibrionales bacterium]|nr:ACP S-malonyltransferase [Chitinivibrionales bacterium]